METAAPKPIYDHVDYLEKLIRIEEVKKTIRRSKALLKRYDFDTIAFRGMSGALIAPHLALALNKHLILVRKNITDTHSEHTVEGNKGSLRYVIVDDLIATGNTVRTILDAVHVFAPKAICIGVLESIRDKRKELTPIHDGWMSWKQPKPVPQNLGCATRVQTPVPVVVEQPFMDTEAWQVLKGLEVLSNCPITFADMETTWPSSK